MLSVVSARYARALVDVVTEPGSKTDPAQVLSQLRAVRGADSRIGRRCRTR